MARRQRHPAGLLDGLVKDGIDILPRVAIRPHEITAVVIERVDRPVLDELLDVDD
jgi:hypothetical protein